MDNKHWNFNDAHDRKVYDHERYIRDRDRRLAMASAYRREHRFEIAAKQRERYRLTVIENRHPK